MQIEVPDVTSVEAGDIVVTAAEGGIGYWARIGEYHWKSWTDETTMKPREVPEDFVFYRITYENPAGPGVGHADITPKLIAEGVKIALQKRSIRADLIEQMTDPEDRAGMDADAADCVIQLGVFGEVVFG